LTYEQLDSILWGLDHSLPEKEIVLQTRVTPAAIAAVQKAMSIARLREQKKAELAALTQEVNLEEWRKKKQIFGGNTRLML